MSSNKKIIAIVGKTSSGKDTVAKVLKEKYGIPAVVSTTTRPMRCYETNGKEHYFVTKTEMNNILNTQTVLAYTKNDKTGIEYCATLESLPSDTCVYIINPDGIRWLKEHNNNSYHLICVYVDLSEDQIIERGKLRGDDPDTLRLRLESERKEFDEYRDSHDYDCIIYNDKDLSNLYTQIDLFYANCLTEN